MDALTNGIRFWILNRGKGSTRERCVEWITRPSPTTSPNQSDDEDNDAADAVEGSLRWLPSEGSLQTLLRGMESKGVLTWMTMNMDGEKYIKMFDA